MIAHLSHHMFAGHLAMSTQEDGSLPGAGLKWYQTFMYFVLAPAGLFFGITAIVLLSTRPKKKTTHL